MRIQPVIIFLIASVSFGFSADLYIWNKSNRGIYEDDITNISINPRNDREIYVGTSKALYKSTDGGKNYRVVLRPSGEQEGVNDIDISPDRPEWIYAATNAGLYETQDSGKSWNRIYYSSDPESRQCLSVIRDDDVIYVGTQKGLFRKTDQRTNWHMIKEGIDRKPVYHIAGDSHFIYFSTGQTLFQLDKQTYTIQTAFSVGVGEGRSANGAVGQTAAAREDQLIKFVEVSSSLQPYVFVASARGIYARSLDGQEWKRLPTGNLAVSELTSLLILESNTEDKNCLQEDSFECLSLLAGTRKGVYFFRSGKWVPLYKGMETNRVSYLAANTYGTVYAATTKGIYFLAVKESLPFLNIPAKTQLSLAGQDEFDHEPSINEVHKLAIDYAEVNRAKISNWRVLARKKALLPDLSVGLDRDASDLFHWNTGANPDELQKGRDFVDWDVSLSWDLSDLVWSTDQTTIDSRSKLMVELREDILDEVTRMYFERRRTQMELMAGDFVGPQIKMDQEMRIAELTALIDALTGGEFSRGIKDK